MTKGTARESFDKLAREIYVGLWSGDIWKEAGTEPSLRLMLEKTLQPRLAQAAKKISDASRHTSAKGIVQEISSENVLQILQEEIGES